MRILRWQSLSPTGGGDESSISADRGVCRAAMRLLAALVTTPRTARAFVLDDGVECLLALPKASRFPGIRRLASTIIMRSVDYRRSVEMSIEVEVKRAMQRCKKSKQESAFPQQSDSVHLCELLEQLPKVASRHPLAFADVLVRLLEVSNEHGGPYDMSIAGDAVEKLSYVRLSQQRAPATGAKAADDVAGDTAMRVLRSVVQSLGSKSAARAGSAGAERALAEPSKFKSLALSEKSVLRLLRQLVQKSSRACVCMIFYVPLHFTRIMLTI